MLDPDCELEEEYLVSISSGWDLGVVLLSPFEMILFPRLQIGPIYYNRFLSLVALLINFMMVINEPIVSFIKLGWIWDTDRVRRFDGEMVRCVEGGFHQTIHIPTKAITVSSPLWDFPICCSGGSVETCSKIWGRNFFECLMEFVQRFDF